MKSITAHDIMATAYGVDSWLPILTGAQDLREWATAMNGKTVETKNGYQLSLIRDTLFKSQMALSNIALAMRAATELGVIPYTRAVHEARTAHNLVEKVALGFAAMRNENHREIVAAEVTIKVKDGCFDELTGGHNRYTREELEDAEYDYEAIENILEAQEIAATARNSGDRSQSMSATEGKLVTALHDVNQLWDIELTDIEFAESVTAKVALIGKEWPTADAAWDLVLDRLSLSWAAAVEYATTDRINAMKAVHAADKGHKFTSGTTKEEVQAKVERRMAAVDDLHKKPMYARWAVNHVTRRVWRDIKSLETTKARFVERLDKLEQQVFAEERYNAKSTATRTNTGEAVEVDRKQYLPFGDVEEAGIGFGVDLVRMTVFGDGNAQACVDTMPHYDEEGAHYRTGSSFRQYEPDHAGGRDLERDTQEHRDRSWYVGVIEACDNQIAAVTPIYKKLRALDVSLTRMWELFNSEGLMPVAPPVYWNGKGHYLTEEDAVNAINAEQAEWAAKNRMADDDALMEAIELMLTNK